MADPNIQIPDLPAASQANETDLLVARQGTVDKKLAISLLKELILNGKDFTGQDILDLLAPVDGDGSGLDADLLDGQEGSYYTNASNLNAGTLSTDRLDANSVLNLIKTVDGTGSGLNADLLDGLQGSDYVKVSADQSISGVKTFTGTVGAYYSGQTPSDAKAKFGRQSMQYLALYGNQYGHYITGVSESSNPKDSILFGISTDGGSSLDSEYTLKGPSGDIWHSGNDGAGSGLNADLLDGQEGSFYRNASNINSGTLSTARLNASDVLTLIKTVDGSGSGLDADLLAGKDAAHYLNAANLTGIVPNARMSGNYSGIRINASNMYTGTVPVDRLPVGVENRRGIVKIASVAEINNGTGGSIAVNPAGMRYGVTYSLGNNGYIKFPSWLGGLTLQWGNDTIPGDSSAVIYYQRNFTSVFAGFATHGQFISTQNDAGVSIIPGTTNATIYNGVGNSSKIYWLVIGVS